VNSMDKIAIPLSRIKLLGFILFLTVMLLGYSYVLGLWFVGRLPRDLFCVALLSPIGIVYFLPALLCLLTKLFDVTPGLIIDRHGIFHNSAAASAGMIPWNSISNVSITNTSYKGLVQNSSISIDLRHPLGPEYYEEGSLVTRIYKRMINPFQRSEIKLDTSSLKISFAELAEIINKYYEKYGSA
jgi:hypothetical protein